MMTDVSDFINQQRKYEEKLADIMYWEYIEDQSKGSSYDFLSPDGSKIEAKFDWESEKTGNHYLEFSQTSDGGETWVPSGFSISEIEIDYWIVINNEFLRYFQIKVLKKFLQKNRRKFKIVQSRKNINNNRSGQFSKGYLIPFDYLDKIANLKIKSPISK